MSIAPLIELPLFGAGLTEEDVARGCESARRQGYAAVVVQPCDLDQAARWIGSSVHLGTIIESTGTTSAKAFAVRDSIRRGAREVNTVLNSRKLRARQFQYLEMELAQMAEACHESAATLTVHIESEYLNEELKMLVCRLSRRAGVDRVGTHASADLPFLREHAQERFELMFTGEIAGLDALLALRDGGCVRMRMTDPDALVAEFEAARQQAETPT